MVKYFMLRKLAVVKHSGEIKCPSEIQHRGVTEAFFGDDSLLVEQWHCTRDKLT